MRTHFILKRLGLEQMYVLLESRLEKESSNWK